MPDTSIPHAWKLQDAKARFSEVVREARARGPQTVTVHGKEAVVVLSTEEYAHLKAVARYPTLHALMSEGPLRDLDFDFPAVLAPVRDVDL